MAYAGSIGHVRDDDDVVGVLQHLKYLMKLVPAIIQTGKLVGCTNIANDSSLQKPITELSTA